MGALDGAAVGGAGRDDKEIATSRVAAGLAHPLRTFPGQVEDELGMFVLVKVDLSSMVPVELKLPQHETEGLDFDLLDEQWRPGWHSRISAIKSRKCSNASRGFPLHLNILSVSKPRSP